MTIDTLPEPAVEPTRPPEPALAPRAWLRRHLFNTWYDALITVVFGGVTVWVLVALLRFLLAADFTILRVNLTLFVLGAFPRDQLWRPSVAILLIGLLVGSAAGASRAAMRDKAAASGLPFRPTPALEVLRRFWPLVALVVMLLLLTQTWTPTVLAVAVTSIGIGSHRIGWLWPRHHRRKLWIGILLLPLAVYGVLAGFGGIGWQGWGGLHLNLFLSIAGILFAFPLGLMLALGRRSSLPAVRAISVAYIEFIRGVPLITLLLMGVFALGFFLPTGVGPGGVTRVLVAITLFEAAYIAEVIRGGLQAVPKGQIEASQALGMPPWKTMRRIVLPQALRATIPAMVGQFISLYKDTTLVSTVGLPDVLSTSQGVNSQPQFLAQGLERLTLLFAALIFWVGSYTMSREARRLEKRLGVGER